MVNTYTVLGASGNVGKQAAFALLAAGHHVRVVLRNIDSDAAKALKNAGATLVASGYVEGDEKLGTLSIDETILTQAFTGVDGAFALIPPNLTSNTPDEDADAYIALLKRAVVASKLKKIVLLSSVGAHRATGNGAIAKLHRLEKTFESIAGPQLRVVFIRAGFFFVNLLSGLPYAASGTLALPYPKDMSAPMLSTDDIGDEVAKHLLDDAHTSGAFVVELAGPKDHTLGDVAVIVSEILGKEVQYAQLPADVLITTLKSFGFSQVGAESLAGMIAAIEAGTLTFEHPDKIVRGSRPLKPFIEAALKK